MVKSAEAGCEEAQSGRAYNIAGGALRRAGVGLRRKRTAGREVRASTDAHRHDVVFPTETLIGVIDSTDGLTETPTVGISS